MINLGENDCFVVVWLILHGMGVNKIEFKENLNKHQWVTKVIGSAIRKKIREMENLVLFWGIVCLLDVLIWVVMFKKNI